MRLSLAGLCGVTTAAALAMAACGGGGPGAADDAPDAATAVTLSFVTPTPGATVLRDHLEPTFGWRAADLAVEVAHTGDVATIELAAGGADTPVATLDADGRASLTLTHAGPRTLVATARDAAGTPLATASLDVTVADPEVASCRAWLDLYGVAYTVGPANEGVSDPVTLTLPVNGMRFRYIANTTQRSKFFMDCTLARSLVLAAPFWRTRGVVEVADYGVYNYRCIGSGTPPNCPNGMSQHAYAKAIDLAAFTTADDATYTVETDWVIDPAAERTCEAATAGDKDAWLHQVICALKADDVWNIVLTPNYNADHRDHFHVDLTAGSDFIRKPGVPPTSPSLDEGPNDW